MNIPTVSPEMAEQLEALEREHWSYRAPLTRRFLANPSGRPIKTEITHLMPELSRRERRALIRYEEKKHKA